MNGILKIKPDIKAYAWGNDYFIAGLLEKDKNGPIAEMWMGAHRRGSSLVEETGEKLCDFLDSHPDFAGVNADGFPYLFKVLAIARSLSIQCHPDAEQAKEGFAAEEAKRKVTDRSLWNYQDSNPKAEMLYALTPVTAMCGFRELDTALGLFRAAVPNFYTGYLSEIGSLYELFDCLYRMAPEILSRGEAELLKNCDTLLPEVRDIVRELGDIYFEDPGVFAPLFLNVIKLNPGQAVYLKPRVLHAYVSGNGIELMNNSDNVLRAGLTKKHMDVDELEKVMTAEPCNPVPMPCVTDRGGTHFICEGGFTLTSMINGEFEASAAGPKILLCTEGEAKIKADGECMALHKGECCIIGSVPAAFTVVSTSAAVFMANGN